ncbi:MAG: hypothetical protein Q9181_003105 [Wetmoreana brouardii]
MNHHTSARPGAFSNTHTSDPSHSNSRTWVSPRIREKDEWKRINDGIHAMNLNHPDHSPFVPKSFEEYLQHKAEFLNDRKREMQAKWQERYFAATAIDKRVAPALDGKSVNDGRSAVLAMETVWCPWDEPTENHPQAPWPHKEEMREEGDERHTSQFGRFLALPRNPGNETVTYKQRSPVKQHYMDRVWEIPNPEDIGEWVEEEEMEGLLGESLLRELDR